MAMEREKRNAGGPSSFVCSLFSLLGRGLDLSQKRKLTSSIKANAPRMRTGSTVPVGKAVSESSTASSGSPSPLRSLAAGTAEVAAPILASSAE